MERRVKERLVGATILVVLVVLIVPELLSGPKRAVETPQASPPGAAAPIRTVIVDLATSKATATDDAAAPAAAEGAAAAGDPADSKDAGLSPTDPAPAAALGQVEQPPQPQPPPQSAAAPQPGPSPLDAAAISPNPPNHGWLAQLGSFAARANAERLERQLRTEGFSPSMSAAGTGSAVRYRVRVGPVPDRAAAEKLVAQLKKAGHPATFIAP